MKKFYILALSLLFLIILGGCGTKVTKEDIVQGAFKNEIHSFDAEMETEVTINANGQKINQTMDIDMKYIEKPFVTHMKISTIEGEGELYLDEESAYMLIPEMGRWFKSSIDKVPDFEKLASGDSVKEDLEKMKKFSDVFKFEENEQGYKLNVELDGTSTEKEKELVMEVMEDSMKDQEFELSKINTFNYSLTLDKEYTLKQVKSDADLDLVMDGEKGQIIIKVQSDYKNVNSVKAFSIPNEVKENAVDPEMGN